MIKISAGPELPPVMQWSRAFSRLLPDICTLQVPRSLNFCPALQLICSKRSWSMAFDANSLEFSISYIADDAGPPALAPSLPAVELPKELTFSSPPWRRQQHQDTRRGQLPLLTLLSSAAPEAQSRVMASRRELWLNSPWPQSARSPRPSPSL